MKRPKKEKRSEDWEQKVLHGQYLRQTKEVRSDLCWAWLQNGDLKRETESLIVHWKLARKCNFEAGDKWSEHEPENVLENERYKIL